MMASKSGAFTLIAQRMRNAAPSAGNSYNSPSIADIRRQLDRAIERQNAA